jgi:sensor histidine kinase YesM
MTREDFIFTKKFPQRLYRHIIFWLLYYLFSVAVYFHDGLEKIGFKKWIVLNLSEGFFHVITQMIFCYTVLYFLLPKFLNKKRYVAFITGIFLLSFIVYWIYFLEHIFIFKAIHFKAGMKFRPTAVVYWFTLISFFTYFPVSTALVIVIKELKNFYLKQKENQLLTRENANAELQLLKAQIHPHFLFNTLNNIYSFTLSKSPEASGLVSKLSDTIHYMITDCKTDFVPLSKELKMLEDYIGLERVRYGDRLELFLEINNDYQNNLIAPLLMIPFVENCFKHGSSITRGKQWIRLIIQVNNGMLDFDLSNSKPKESISTKNKNGIGLDNVKKRLALLYPGKHQLNISSADAVYNVKMQIKLEIKTSG